MKSSVLVKRILVLASVVSFSVFISACSSDAEEEVVDQVDGGVTAGTTVAIDSVFTTGTAEGATEVGTNADDLVENSTFSKTVAIAFGTTVTISNPLSSSGVTISQSGSDVTITSAVKEVNYELSGTTTDGSVKIYSDNKFKVTLNGVSITNADGPALNIQSSKRSFIVIADNTTNTLTDGPTYATSTEDMKGTIFSEGQMIFSGNGSLSVKGNYKHAIASDDYIRVRSGAVTITGAVTDGIHTNDAFIADGGTLKITASSDGIECEEVISSSITEHFHSLQAMME